MAIRGGYAPPGVYTESVFESPTPQSISSGRLPLLIGTGRETVVSNGLTLVRGSSATIDQQIVEEDASGRIVLGENPDGSLILGDFDGVNNELRTKHWPLVTGEGLGATSNSPSSVSVTINGQQTVVLAVNGAEGVVTIAEAPAQGDDVRVSYFFNRTDVLVTNEDLSSQVSSSKTVLRNRTSSSFDYGFTAQTNSLILTVDGVTRTLTLSTINTARADNLTRLVTLINGANFESLIASAYTDNYGVTNLELTADGSISVGSGSANNSLGLFSGQSGSARTVTFFTSYSPIVDGTNGGTTTSSVEDVTVLVNGVAVVPSSVDGANGSITLSSAPLVGAEVLVTYYYNTFRDQYDFLPSRDVTSVTRVSDVPVGGSPASLYDESISWVLKDDKILWGTASLVTDVQDSTFSSSQVQAGLVDSKVYLAECTPITSTTFRLPYQPVDGTGAGKSTSNPALIQAKSGTSISDALERSDIVILRVDPSTSTITLAQPVTAGSKVFATFFYNNIQDQVVSAGGGYKLSVITADRSEVGIYGIKRGTTDLHAVTFEDKGSDLTEIALSFPSGSELLSDARFSGGTQVEENISVQIEDFESTSAVYVTPGFGPYSLGESLSLSMDMNGTDLEAFDLSASQHVPLIIGNVLPYTNTSNEQNVGDIDGTLLFESNGSAVSVNITQAGADVNHIADAINGVTKSIPASITGMNSLPDNLEIKAGSSFQVKISYTGNNSGTILGTVDIAAAVYTAQQLIDEINDGIIAEWDGVLSDQGAGTSNLVFSLDPSNRVVITLSDTRTGGNDDYGMIYMGTNGATDMTNLLGIETGTRWGLLPFATFTSVGAGANGEKSDRLIIKGRTLCGEYYVPPTRLRTEIIGGDLVEIVGMDTSFSVDAESGAYNNRIVVSMQSSEWNQDLLNITAPNAVLYDGSGAESANDILNLTVNGQSVSIDLGGNAGGAQVSFSSIGVSIQNAVSAIVPGSVTRMMGNLITLFVPDQLNSSIVIGDGSANSLLGLVEGRVYASDTVSVETLASALMAHSGQKNSNALRDYLLSDDVATEATAQGDYLPSQGLVYVERDSSNRGYLAFQSKDRGVGSTIEFLSSTFVNEIGSGLGINAGDSAQGEASYQGFIVTSDHPSGSGSANTAFATVGAVGQQGVIGQTYVDDVTGLSFTLLAREGGQPYPTGNNATLSFRSSKQVITNNSIPVNVIPGVSLTVSNTTGMTVGDTVFVETFNKGGREPSIGQVYYLDLIRKKSAFGTAVFNRLADVIAEFGDVAPENTLTMGAYYAFLNGTNTIALHQVPLEEGQTELTTTQVLEAIQAVEGDVAPDVTPFLIVPLVPANELILTELSRHCDVQSSLRFRSERTGVMGFSAGTQPQEAQRLAKLTQNSRVRVVYPDIVSSTVTNTLGVSRTFLLDGRYLAVAVACTSTSAIIDVATPWTNLPVVGFDSLSRNLDAVEANQTANSGVTVLQQRAGQIIIRHGLTTDMSSVLTKTPTVTQIADEVHRRARDLLNGYIGVKYLPSVITQIEGRVNNMFKQLVQEQIIDTFSGISISRDPEDPTGLLVEAYYKPVFPLLYIQFTFNIRSSS